MSRRESVADVEIRQGGQLLHQQGFRLLLVGQSQLLFEEGLLLGDKADVVQQKDLSVLERPDLLPGGGAAHVVDPLHLPFQQTLQHRRVGPGCVEILVLNVAALMSQQHHLRAFVGKLSDGGDTGGDPIDALQSAGLPIHRLVDVHPAQDGFALKVGLVQGADAKAHGGFLLNVGLRADCVLSTER